MRFFDNQRSQMSRLNHNPTTNKKISNLHVNHNAKKSTPLSSTPHNKPYLSLSIPRVNQKANPLPHPQPDHLSLHLPSLLNYRASHLGWHRLSMPSQRVCMTSNYTAHPQIMFHPEYYASAHSDWKSAIRRIRNVVLQWKATMTNTHHQRELRRIWVSFWEHLVEWKDDRKYYPYVFPGGFLLRIFSIICFSAIRHLFSFFFSVSYGNSP